jgi:hypothetical protein
MTKRATKESKVDNCFFIFCLLLRGAGRPNHQPSSPIKSLTEFGSSTLGDDSSDGTATYRSIYTVW